jgi:coenzyme F420-dependent glucose-6-phosphate dehydrogenase
VPRIDVARTACHWWAALALSGEEKRDIHDPIELERLADANADRAPSRFIVSADPDECVERIGAYVDQGFTHLVFHAPGPRRHRFLEDFAADVLPRLRERYGIAAQAA